MSGSLDLSELNALAAHLEKSTDGIVSQLRPVMQKGGVNMKKQLRAEAQGTRYPRLPYTIGYDSKETQKSTSVKVGPESKGVGKMANIMYFGGSNGGGGTLPDPMGALEAEAPRATEAVLDVVEKLLKGG